jgi:sRNA-binding protein
MSQARKERGFVAVSQLIQMFPAAFDRFDRKPLKLGIHDDLLAREIASDVVRAGLRSYCNAAGYLSAMKPARRGSTLTATRPAW